MSLEDWVETPHTTRTLRAKAGNPATTAQPPTSTDKGRCRSIYVWATSWFCKFSSSCMPTPISVSLGLTSPIHSHHQLLPYRLSPWGHNSASNKPISSKWIPLPFPCKRGTNCPKSTGSRFSAGSNLQSRIIRKSRPRLGAGRGPSGDPLPSPLRFLTLRP